METPFKDAKAIKSYEALEVACVYCGAGAGEKCTRANGSKVSYYHLVRRNDANMADLSAWMN